MDDLLKEAIADAKAVRETALENAKMALEEAFTPRLQNMLSQKIQTEMEDEDEKDMEEREDMMDADEDPSDEDSQEEMAMAMKDADEDPSDEDSEDVDESKIIEIDGVKYAPVVSEEEDEEMEDESEEDDMEEDLDLEAVIKELESELDEAEEDDDKEEMEEQSTSSGIGKGTSVKQASSSDEEDPQGAKLKEGENPFAKKDKDEDEMDEDIDLDEVLKALSEEEDEEKEVDEVSKLQSDLDEHRSVIETLRGKLNEVNLLNAKLLFTNKLFRKHGLNNEQKMKVVEQFDRASNLREVKLVYSTLGESFGARKNEINEHKGSASKPIASTKSEKKVISEGSDLRDRFKKLANLI